MSNPSGAQPSLTLFLDYMGTSREMLRGNALYIHQLRAAANEIYGRTTILMATMGYRETHKNLALLGFDGIFEIGGKHEILGNLHVWEATVSPEVQLPKTFERADTYALDALSSTLISEQKLVVRHYTKKETAAFVAERQGDKMILVDDDIHRAATKISAYTGVFKPTDRGARVAAAMADKEHRELYMAYGDFDGSPKVSPQGLIHMIQNTLKWLDAEGMKL